MSNFAVPYTAPAPALYPAMYGGITQMQPTLEAHLQQWLAQVTHQTTLSLINGGLTDPSQFPTVALAVANSVISEGSPPDASKAIAFAAQYGAMAQAAYKDVPASQWNVGTFTDTSDTPDTPATPVPPLVPPSTSLFGVALGDGRFNLSSLAMSQILAGTLLNGVLSVNPADSKTYVLTFAIELMGISGYWTPQAAAPPVIVATGAGGLTTQQATQLAAIYAAVVKP